MARVLQNGLKLQRQSKNAIEATEILTPLKYYHTL